MPKRRCSAQEEVQNLNLRAAESRAKIGRRRVQLTMQNCPSSIPHLVELLESLGYTDERIAVKESMPQSFQQQARKRAKKEPAAGDPTAEPKTEHTVPDSPPAPAAADPILGTYWRIDALSRTLLRDKIVSMLDPVAWGRANLRVSLEALGTERNKMELLRLFEFATGFPPELAVTGDLRDFGSLTQVCVGRAQARGRRSLTVSLPSAWTTHGVYELAGIDGEQRNVLVVHRFTDFKTQIPASKLPPFKVFEDLKLDRNWSERSTCITSVHDKTNDSVYSLSNDFKQQTMYDDGQAPKGFQTPLKVKSMKTSLSEAPPTSEAGASRSVGARAESASLTPQAAPVVTPGKSVGLAAGAATPPAKGAAKSEDASPAPKVGSAIEEPKSDHAGAALDRGGQVAVKRQSDDEDEADSGDGDVDELGEVPPPPLPSDGPAA